MENGNSAAKRENKKKLTFASVLEHHKVHTFYWENHWTTETESSPEFLEASYHAECQLNNTRPLPGVITQLKEKNVNFSLKGEKLDLPQVDSLEIILKLVQFKSVNIENSFLNQDSAAAVFDMLLHYESCENVSFGFNRNMGHRAWISAAQFIKRSSRIHTFDANSAIIPDSSLAPFSRALRSSLFVRCIRLENCSLSGRPIALLTAGMRQNNSISELYLADNRLSPEDGAHLRALISLSNTLTLLDLRNNNLQDIGLLHICEGLKTAKCNLETLVLWNNKISIKSIPSLSEALIKNSKLQTLNLGQNAIQENGAYILKQGLQANGSICRLGLVGCRLTDPGIVAVAEYLAESSKLQRLDLRNNDIGLGGLMALSLAARESTSLTRIDLDKPIRDPTLPQELVERQNQLWDDLNIYCERNKNTDENKNISSSPLSPTVADCNQSNRINQNNGSDEIQGAASGDHGLKKRKEIEFHYAEEPDELLSPKLGSIRINSEQNETGDSGKGPEVNEQDNQTSDQVKPEVTMTIPIRNSEPKLINSPLTPNSAIKAIEVVQSFKENTLP